MRTYHREKHGHRGHFREEGDQLAEGGVEPHLVTIGEEHAEVVIMFVCLKFLVEREDVPMVRLRVQARGG